MRFKNESYFYVCEAYSGTLANAHQGIFTLVVGIPITRTGLFHQSRLRCQHMYIFLTPACRTLASRKWNQNQTSGHSELRRHATFSSQNFCIDMNTDQLPSYLLFWVVLVCQESLFFRPWLLGRLRPLNRILIFRLSAPQVSFGALYLFNHNSSYFHLVDRSPTTLLVATAMNSNESPPLSSYILHVDNWCVYHASSIKQHLLAATK